MDRFARWPTLLAAVTLLTAGLALDLTHPDEATFAAVCVGLGAAAFGAFLYAEGARHREWWTRHHPASHPPGQGSATISSTHPPDPGADMRQADTPRASEPGS